MSDKATFVPLGTPAPTWETFRFQFDPSGHLFLMGREGWREAVCVECNEPIRWVLDMFSFSPGPVHGLAHARCLWTRDGFAEQAERAQA